MEESIREFKYLILRCDIKEAKEQIITQFLGGLKKELANAIKLQPYQHCNDVGKLAMTIEQ